MQRRDAVFVCATGGFRPYGRQARRCFSNVAIPWCAKVSAAVGAAKCLRTYLMDAEYDPLVQKTCFPFSTMLWRIVLMK